MESESSATGLFGVLRLLRQFRKATKAAELPTIPAEFARHRYEPLIESLADELAGEFGVEWRPSQGSTRPQHGRTFETTRWVADRSLTQFPDWLTRLAATAGRVVDIVDVVEPAFSAEKPPSMSPELEHRLAAFAGEPARQGGAQDEGRVAGFSMVWRARDRLGADVLIMIEDDQTTLSAIASVTRT